VGAVGIEPTTSPVWRERSAKNPNEDKARLSRSPRFDALCSRVDGAKTGRLTYGPGKCATRRPWTEFAQAKRAIEGMLEKCGDHEVAPELRPLTAKTGVRVP